MNTFPTFTGLQWDIKKRVLFSNATETSASGAEYRTGRWSLPHFEFDLSWDYLSQADRATFEAFVIQQQGSLTPFLLGCVNNDNAMTDASCGTPIGTTKNIAIPLPAQAQVVATTSIKGNGVAVSATSVATPAAPTLGQVTSGAKGARTYFARITYVDAAGGESPASPEASLAVSANKVLTLASPPASPGAVSYRVYLNTVTNSEAYQVTYGIGTAYQEPTTALSFAGATYPTVTTSGGWSVSAAGVITFAANITPGTVITWSGSYAYLVRFPDDPVEFNQMMDQMHEQGGVTFRTVR